MHSFGQRGFVWRLRPRQRCPPIHAPRLQVELPVFVTYPCTIIFAPPLRPTPGLNLEVRSSASGKASWLNGSRRASAVRNIARRKRKNIVPCRTRNRWAVKSQRSNGSSCPSSCFGTPSAKLRFAQAPLAEPWTLDLGPWTLDLGLKTLL